MNMIGSAPCAVDVSAPPIRRFERPETPSAWKALVDHTTGDRIMIQSHPIEVNGVFVGAAIRLDQGYRFVALSLRLDDLDGVIRPQLQDIRALAERMYSTRMPALS
jgi:hypothetical protein